jgi:threonine/homoserine/homoserine lactone efflux protein
VPALSTLLLFAVAATVLIVIPGPAVMYIVARGVDQGRRAGVVSALGVNAGSFVHVVAATLGLSAILVSSAVAFSVVKYAGAAYLIYLGARTLMRREKLDVDVSAPPLPLGRVFYQGVLVNVFNPKVAIFFFAFLPQFVKPGHGATAWQIFLFGSLFVLIGVCSDSAYALLAGTAGRWLRGNLSFARVQRYVAGGVYIALGLVTAVAGSGNPTEATPR